MQRLEEVLLVVVHRQDQDAQVRQQAGQLARGLQPGQPRHRDVQDRQVRLLLARQADRLRAVAGLGHHRQVRFVVEDQPDTATDQRVVVGEHDPHGHPAGLPRRDDAAGPRCRRARCRVHQRVRWRRSARRRPATPVPACPGCPAPSTDIAESAAVVANAQLARRTDGRAAPGSTCSASRVPHRVGEAFLRDAVDDQLGLGVQLGQVLGRTPARTLSPVCPVISAASAFSALTSPSSSSTPGRSLRAMRRISSSVLRVVSCT